jgi:cobalt-zinc-cadmium efflux system protein
VDDSGRSERDSDQHDKKREHGHDHAGHDHGAAIHTHGVSADADSRYLTVAFLLIVGFMGFEVVVGILPHSLALLSDAAHMLTDAGALALSLVILRFAALCQATGISHRRQAKTIWIIRNCC